MTPNNPKSVQPESFSSEEPVEELSNRQERPNPEKVSPSQRGRFLSAMDEKGGKKGEKKVTSSTASVDEPEDPEAAAGGDIFHLSSVKGLKKERALTDALGGESGSPTTQKGQKQATVKSTTTHVGTQEQQLLAMQAVASQEASREASREAASHKATPSPKTKMMTGAQNIQSTPESQLFAEVDKGEKKRAPEAFSEYERLEFMSHTKVDTGLSESQKKAAPTPVQAFSEAPQTVVASKAEPGVSDTRATLLEIIKQTIDALSILKTKEESTITVSIKNPPMFAGATIKIVESTSAKNEFNITFDNLTPEARRIIETQANQVHLQQALVEKGYTLRNVVIAPEVKFEPLVASVSTGKTDEQTAQERRYTEGFDQGETSKGKSQK
jgi:hypothetical protein